MTSGPSALAAARRLDDRPAVELDRNGLEVLDDDECLALLGAHSFGRIAISDRALPAILPVNYHLVGRHIVFRTGRGTKLDAATHNSVVAFEIDGMDPVSHTGWSVLAVGVARDLTDVISHMTFDVTQIPKWAPGGDDRVVVVVAELLSGRRLAHDTSGAALAV